MSSRACRAVLPGRISWRILSRFERDGAGQVTLAFDEVSAASGAFVITDAPGNASADRLRRAWRKEFTMSATVRPDRSRLTAHRLSGLISRPGHEVADRGSPGLFLRATAIRRWARRLEDRMRVHRAGNRRSRTRPRGLMTVVEYGDYSARTAGAAQDVHLLLDHCLRRPVVSATSPSRNSTRTRSRPPRQPRPPPRRGCTGRCTSSCCSPPPTWIPTRC
jgi:hypothetical protein